MVDPKKIKITLPIPPGSAKTGSTSVAWMHLHGLTVEESATRVEKKTGMFSGAEEEAPRDKALKKIQIEIVRNLKGGIYNRHNSPVRRSLKPYDTLLLPRRQDEGQTPLFEFIQALAAETTKRIISLDGGGSGDRGNTGRRRSRSRSPLRNKNRSRSPIDTKRSSNLYSDAGGGGQAGGGDVRARLGSKGDRENRGSDDRYKNQRGSSPAGARPRSTNIHSRLGQRREGGNGDVRSRLSRSDNGGGGRMTDEEDEGQVLNREELESQRPAAPAPWEANPEMVPRGGYYFEHDDREGDRDPRGQFGSRFDRGGRGGFRGRFQRGGYRGRGMGNRGFYDRRGRDSSPDWKHDKFDPGADDQA